MRILKPSEFRDKKRGLQSTCLLAGLSACLSACFSSHRASRVYPSRPSYGPLIGYPNRPAPPACRPSCVPLIGHPDRCAPPASAEKISSGVSHAAIRVVVVILRCQQTSDIDRSCPRQPTVDENHPWFSFRFFTRFCYSRMPFF